MKYDFDNTIDRKNTKCYQWDYNQEIFGKEDVISLWVADMDFEVPFSVQKALSERIKHPVLGYTGEPKSYFLSFINWLDKQFNWKIEKDWMITTPGIVPSINFAIQTYTEPKDKILIQEPVYYPFSESIKNNDRILVNSTLQLIGDRYEMDFNDLKKKLADNVKMMILCSPHNPVGRVWKRNELERVGKLCLQNNVLLISDEIHSDLVLNGNKHIPISTLSPEINNITISMFAPSKTFNLAGLSTSTIVIPNKKLRIQYKQYLKKLGLHLGNIFGIEAYEAAYTEGEEWLKQLLKYIESNYKFVVNYLIENIPQIVPVELEGTYLMWLDCRKLGLPQNKLVELFVHKAGLGLNDGSKFGNGGVGFMRLNIACSRSLLEEALDRLKKAVYDHTIDLH